LTHHLWRTSALRFPDNEALVHRDQRLTYEGGRKKILVAGELAELWMMLNPRLVYCLLLALDIYFAMLREQKIRGKGAQ